MKGFFFLHKFVLCCTRIFSFPLQPINLDTNCSGRLPCLQSAVYFCFIRLIDGSTMTGKLFPHSGGNGPLIPVLYIRLEDFSGWFEGRLQQKYTYDIDKLLSDIRPLIVLFSQLFVCARDLGLLLQLEREPELLSFKPNVDNIIHLLSALTHNFPPCVDIAFVTQLIASSSEVMQNIHVFLHPFEHLEVEDTSLQSKL